jgi:hypothetical protein
MKNSKRSGLILAIILVVVVEKSFSAPRVQEAQRIQWAFKTGQTLHYMRTQNRVVDIEDRPRFQTTERVTYLKLVVDQVEPDGSALITQTIDRLQYRVLGPDGSPQVDFDSEEKQDAPPKVGLRSAEHLRVLVGASCTFVMQPNGLIQDLQISEATKTALAEQPPEIARTFNENAFKLLAPSVILPDDEVQPDESWTEQANFDNPLAGNTDIVTRYRFVGQEEEDGSGRSFLKIEAKVDIKLEQDPDAEVVIQIEEFENEGTIHFDNEAGRLLERVNRERMRSRSTIEGRSIQQTVTGLEKTEILSKP